MACDIRDREAIDACVEQILEKTGRIDILVNNGGGQFFCPASAISPKGWDAVVATNLTGTWNLTRAVADRSSTRSAAADLRWAGRSAARCRRRSATGRRGTPCPGGLPGRVPDRRPALQKMLGQELAGRWGACACE